MQSTIAVCVWCDACPNERTVYVESASQLALLKGANHDEGGAGVDLSARGDEASTMEEAGEERTTCPKGVNRRSRENVVGEGWVQIRTTVTFV